MQVASPCVGPWRGLGHMVQIRVGFCLVYHLSSPIVENGWQKINADWKKPKNIQMDLCINQQKFHPLCGKCKCLSSSVDLFQLCWNIPSIIRYSFSGLNHRVNSKINPRD